MILYRYLIKEILQAFVATLLVLMLIIVGNTVARLLGDVSDGELPADVLGELVLIGSIKGAIQLAPIALLIGMMLAFGRLYRDNEISSMHASGIGPGQFFKTIFLLLTPLTLLLSFLVLSTLPTLETTRQEITAEVKQRPEASGIPIGEFLHAKSGANSFTMFVETLGDNDVVMKNFFMNIEGPANNRSMIAKEAILFIDQKSGDRVLQITDGTRYEQHKIDETLTIIKFGEHGLRVPPLSTSTNTRLGSKPTLSLIGSDDAADTAELHWRLGVILSAPIMALLAFPLSYTTPRQGRFGKLALGILFYALYANLLITGKSMLEDGKIPAIFGLWWAHLPFLLLSLWMVWRRYGGFR